MNIVEFFLYAGTLPGINFILGFILSFLLDWWPKYGELTSKSKRLIAMGLSFVIPVTSVVGLYLLGEIAIDVNTIWYALFTGFTAYFGSQTSHLRDLKTKPKDPLMP